MRKKIKKHLLYYISLITMLLLGLILVVLANPNLRLQMLIIFGIIILFILWGGAHHLKNHQLTGRIMVEYILVGLLGIAILFFMMTGGLI